MPYSFTETEKRRVFELVEKLVGTTKIASERAEIFLNNLERRIYLAKKKNLQDYLSYASQNFQEHGYLISSLTIHTTYWFREAGHFEMVKTHFSKDAKVGKLRAISLGCSTGEEVYSLALVLESLRAKLPNFDYEILGLDIDPVSIEKAQKAIYDAKELEKIPLEYHSNVLIGSGKTAGLMTLPKQIRDRVKFRVHSAVNISKVAGDFELGLCRNMLIYFDEASVNRIVNSLAEKIVPQGIFMLGHSENFDNRIGFAKMGASVFRNDGKAPREAPATGGYENIGLKEELDGKLDALIYCRNSSYSQTVNDLFNRANFSHQSVSSEKELHEQLQVRKISVLILGFLGEPVPGDLQFVRDLRRDQHNLPILSIIDDDLELESLREFKKVTDEAIGIRKFESHRTKMLERISSIVELKKAGGRFSQLPVAVVDDDEYVAESFANILMDAGFTVETFHSGFEVLDYIRLKPLQAIVSDFKMPGMDGGELSVEVRKIRGHLPFIIVSGMTKDIGKIDAYRILSKPVDPDGLVQVVHEALLDRYNGNLLQLDQNRVKCVDLVVIGGSTGAPPVFQKILSQLPRPYPPVVVVQHIPPKFQTSFAQELAYHSGLDLKLVSGEEELKRNTLYVADVDKHIQLKPKGDKFVVESDESSPYKGLRPCVHRLFESASRLHSTNVLGVLLTGMGDDGSMALGSMRKAGQYTVAQDLSSSVVFGMPKVAIDFDNVDYIGSADKIHELLKKIVAA